MSEQEFWNRFVKHEVAKEVRAELVVGGGHGAARMKAMKGGHGGCLGRYILSLCMVVLAYGDATLCCACV